MKNFRMLNFILMVALVSLLAVGCAKQPTEDTMTPPPETSTTVQKEDPGMKEIEVKETTMATISDLTRVHFDFDSYELSSEARATLRQNAMLLKSAPMLKVTIEGHCDERGSGDYNLALGMERAQATLRFLKAQGVPAGQMDVSSKGELEPLDEAGTEAAWAKNRRAEFVAM